MSAPNRFYVVDTRYAHMMMDHLNHAQQWIGGLEDQIAVQADQIDAQARFIADQRQCLICTVLSELPELSSLLMFIRQWAVHCAP